MFRKTIESVPFYFFENLSQFPQLIHFISTRSGGYSNGSYDSLNLSLRVNDSEDLVKMNRLRIAELFDIPGENMIFSLQNHGVKVEVIDEEFLKLSEKDKMDVLNGVDGMITALPQVCLNILTADCASIILYDPLQKVIGVAHAGWKGTVGKIAGEICRLMHLKFRCNPPDLYAAIGPCISLASFEVGEEVAQIFRDTFPDHKHIVVYREEWKKPHVDIVRANQQVLLEYGMTECRIEFSGICTFQEPDIFFSARRNAGGRFGCGVMLK